jgi:S-adenosylmethionine/arginine decarboxylase-like enzyme
MTKILHNHLLMNGQAYQPPRDVESVKAWLTQLVSDIGMKIVTGPHAHYVEAEGNRGITAAVCIETSHIAFHVWDEEVPARVQFDLYTCSTLPTDAVLEACEKYFDLVDYHYVVLNREDGFVIEKTGQRV